MNLTLNTIAAALELPLFEADRVLTGLSWDSRTMAEQMLFAAVAGERVNGHRFIRELDARFSSVAFLVTELLDFAPRNPVLQVPDLHRALAKIAGAQAARLSAKIVGVTGSVGKTTTKNMILAALAPCMPASGTAGNQNNELGVPMTVLSVREYDRAAVVEMGMRGTGQIKALTDCITPDLAVITNIGVAHLELLGSRENIARAKLEMVDALPAGGMALLNGDEPLLYGARPAKTCYYFGKSSHNDYRAVSIRGNRFTLCYPGGTVEIALRVEGEHQVMNALAAFGVGHLLGGAPALLKQGIESFTGDGRRMFEEQVGGVTVIDDSYNAAPDSMAAALRVLAARPPRRIAVLGDMLELGSYEAQGHREVGALCGALGIDAVITAGPRAKMICDALPAQTEKYHVAEGALALPVLEKILKPGDTVLFKASNAMKFQAVANALKERMGKHS